MTRAKNEARMGAKLDALRKERDEAQAALGRAVDAGLGWMRKYEAERKQHAETQAAANRMRERDVKCQSALRQIRRWIESEDQPGERTAEVYQLAGKMLDY